MRLYQNECFELQKVERLFNLTKQYVHVHTYMQKKKRAVDRRKKMELLPCGLHYSSWRKRKRRNKTMMEEINERENRFYQFLSLLHRQEARPYAGKILLELSMSNWQCEYKVEFSGRNYWASTFPFLLVYQYFFYFNITTNTRDATMMRQLTHGKHTFENIRDNVTFFGRKSSYTKNPWSTDKFYEHSL